MGKVALGNVFSPTASVIRCQFHTTNDPYSSSSVFILIRKANRQSLEGLKKQCCFGNAGALDKKVLSGFAETYRWEE